MKHPPAFGSGWVVVLVFSVFGFLATALAISALGTYGWTLFVGLPFGLGFMPVLVRGAKRRLTFIECFGLSTIPVMIVATLGDVQPLGAKALSKRVACAASSSSPLPVSRS